MEPPPLSAFFQDGRSALPPANAALVQASCLQAPLFLGVHVLGLGEEIQLDGGALIVRTDAAVHSDPGAEILRSAGSKTLEQRTTGPTPAMSGSRVLSGAFLRAAVTVDSSQPPLHVWLNPESADVISNATEPPGSVGGLHLLWPYRIRVLYAIITEATAEAVGLQPMQSLEVRIAVDKAAGVTGESEVLLPRAGEPPLRVWLSTQGDRQLSLVAPASPSTTEGSAPQAFASGSSISTKMPVPSQLPPLSPLSALPPLPSVGVALPAAAAVEEEADTDALDLTLHVQPVAERTAESAPFECPLSEWTIELCAMLLGRHEVHASVPLPVSAAKAAESDEDAADMSSLRGLHHIQLGSYSIGVIQCTGHHLSPLADGRVLSEYPLLLLHVQLEISFVNLRRQEAEHNEGVDGSANDESSTQLDEIGHALSQLLGDMRPRCQTEMPNTCCIDQIEKGGE